MKATETRAPSTCAPSMCSTAASACSRLAYSTRANPLGRCTCGSEALCQARLLNRATLGEERPSAAKAAHPRVKRQLHARDGAVEACARGSTSANRGGSSSVAERRDAPKISFTCSAVTLRVSPPTCTALGGGVGLRRRLRDARLERQGRAVKLGTCSAQAARPRRAAAAPFACSRQLASPRHAPVAATARALAPAAARS